jgi:hypothetical protein
LQGQGGAAALALTAVPDRLAPGAGTRRGRPNEAARRLALSVPEAHKPAQSCGLREVVTAAAVVVETRSREAMRLLVLAPKIVRWA